MFLSTMGGAKMIYFPTYESSLGQKKKKHESEQRGMRTDEPCYKWIRVTPSK
jgi:hypothetical protein